ncbi:MAG: TRAP transporter large permease subunit, partial [Rhodobacteraceae bacterium]|nr:TRAP transporter large permease subunit [Paracoccaceae bacterium]
AARLGIRALPRSEIPAPRLVLGGVHFALSFAVLIYLLFWLNYRPERAALWASLALIGTAFLIGYRGARPTLRGIFASLTRCGHGVVEIILISAASGIVIGVLNVTGLSFNLTYALVQIGGGNAILFLFLSALVCIVLGMGLPTLGVYALLAALVAPALIQIGIDPIGAHLYVLYFGMMSMITPPIALAAFAAASIANAPAMKTGWAAVRFGWSAYVIPVLFVASPTLLLSGHPPEIALAVATSVFGVWLVSSALAGYFAGPLSRPMRAGFIVTGLMALVPAAAFEGAVVSDVLGVLGGIVLMAVEALRNRRAAREPVA